MQISQLDHLVLTVADLDRTCAFYSSVLGMEIRTSDNNRKSLHFDTGKINLHQAGAEFSPHALKPTPGSADICLLTKTPIQQVMEHLIHHQVDIIEGPVKRTGATGTLLSVYFRDPDGNLIEVANPLSTMPNNQHRENKKDAACCTDTSRSAGRQMGYLQI